MFILARYTISINLLRQIVNIMSGVTRSELYAQCLPLIFAIIYMVYKESLVRVRNGSD
jgi:hypothetical protein